MLRISALNDSSCSEDDSQKIELIKTKEAKEAEAFAAYNKALSHQQKGNTLHAEKLLRNLFDHPLLKEASNLVGDENQTQTLNHPGLHLLYSIHKNLASILLQRGQLQEAIAAYIEAVKIDSSEVTVWFKMGQVAKELHNYPLAKICFQQALQCNPNHWPSLDNAITVTYALGDYLTCLENISTALEKDCTYPKGLAFRKQILSEQPSLESVTKELFIYCDPKIHMITVDADEAKEHINEALKFRATRRHMILEQQEKEHQPLTFRKPLTPFTWKNVGEQLIDLYDFAVSSNPPKSLALEVDLRDYFFLDHLVFLGENATQDKQPPPVQAEKEGHPGPPSPAVKRTAFGSAKSDVNSTFQGVGEKNARIPLVPQSLNIRDSAKESALIKRIHGDFAVNEVFTAPEDPGIIGKLTTEVHSQPVSDANEPMADEPMADDPMADELELDAMDMNDVPLLQDEDINMAVLSLKDIRKADFRPDLLLKTNEEDFKELRDARTLESVLSTVIDLEMQEMYQKVTPTSEQGELSRKSGIYASPPTLETGTTLTSDNDCLNQSTVQPQNTVSSTSNLISDPLEPQSGSAAASAQTEVNMVSSVMADCGQGVSYATTSPAQTPHKVCGSLGQAVSSTGSTHEIFNLPTESQRSRSIPEFTPEGCTSTISADTTQTQGSPHTHSSHKASVSPSSVQSILIQEPQKHYQPSPATVSSPLTHSLPAHVSTPGHASRPAPIASSLISQTHSSLHTPQSSRSISSFPFQSSTPTTSEAPPVWTVNLPSEPLPQSPRTPMSSPVQVSQPSSLYYSLIQPSQQTSHSFTQVSQTRPQPLPALSQLNIMPAPLNLSEKTFRLNVLPTEHVHSPIATSLLSPNSSSSCPKLASAYHSVLSSIDQSDTDSSTYKTPLCSQPNQKPDLSPSVPARGTTKSSHRDDSFTSIKSFVYQSSSGTLKNMSADEYIADVANQLLREACADRSPQKTKVHQQSPVSSYYSSPSPNPASVQAPSKHSPQYQQELASLSQPHALLNTPTPHRAPSPNISIPRADAQMGMFSRYHSEHEPFMESPSSFPHPMKLQPQFDSERRPEKQIDHRPTGTQRARPPPLSRSASMPGYYTNSLEHSLLSYLSLPQVPYTLPPFLSSERRSLHIPCQPSPSLVGLFSPTGSLPCSHPEGSNLFPGPLYSSLSSAPSTFSFPASTALPPYLTPPRPPKYMVSQHFHPDSLKLASQLTSRNFFDETTAQKARSVQASPSNSPGHRRFGTSPPAAQAPSRPDQSSQLLPRPPEVTTQLQNLARIAQQVSSTDGVYSVSGDHSYYQRRGQAFQAMVESLLAGTSPASRPACPPLTSMASKGFPQSLESSPHDASKKRGSAGSKTPGSGAKRGPKRKMDESLSDDWTLAYKRRSTRSRNARNRKEDKSIDYQNMLKKYFPRSLLQLEQFGDGDKNVESDMNIDENVAEDSQATGRNAFDITSLGKLSDNEEEDVKAFVKKCLKGHGTLDLIYKFLLHLARRCDLVWYEGIADIFVNLYVRLRKHLTIPSLFYGDNGSFTPEGLKDYATVILAWSELSLSKAAAENLNKSCLLPSIVGQPDFSTTHSLGEYHNEDMMFLLALTGREDALGDFHGEFCVRFYWLKARQHHFLNETADAVECFEIISELLEDVATKKGMSKNNVKVIVPNISEDPVISLAETNRQLECLLRCRSLEDTQKLFDAAKYDQVVDNLVSTFNSKNLSPKSVVQRERPSQLLLLVNSLYNLGRKSECLQWAEVSLYEAVLHYKRAPTAQLQKDWAATLVSLFDCINRLQDEDGSILKTLTGKNLARLADSLVFVIEVSLNVGEHVTEMPIPSLLPWKILYRLLKFEETSHDLNKPDSTGQNSVKELDKENEDEKDQTPLLLMLREAHDYLGRHSWCTRDDGSLLLFTMSVLEPEMEAKNEDDLEELAHMFEQCVYCLFSHPNKRGRARHLSDHNSTPLALTWERAGPVFRHFATQSVPEFDSYRTSTVTADVENLLRRIFALVPDKINPGLKVSVITDYIEGVCNSVPDHQVIAVSKEADPCNISGLLYYLLGDFYFKSKEPTKAIRFYQLDLVLNSNRLDSWAGLALAKMSQIEQKLNSTELKMEKPIHKNSERALKCFHRAVELESGSCKLWLEYGSLAYQLLSHASRQIKYKDMFGLTDEVLQPALSRHREMLLLAKNNYQQASKCEGEGTEEGWLIYYMMGKVAEKQKEQPAVYLGHYLQAAACLHEEKAVYPKKILFVNPRPHLALEALEIFYRIIVSALKLVLSGCQEDVLVMLDKYVTNALQGYFARGEEKQQRAVEEERDGMLISPAAATISPSESVPVYHKNPPDHDYSRHKTGTELQSEGQSSKCTDQASTGSADVDMERHVPLDQQFKESESSSGKMAVDKGNNPCLVRGFPEAASDITSVICAGAAVGNAGFSCIDPLKQTSVEICQATSTVSPRDVFEEERMDICESAAECEVVTEITGKSGENDSDAEKHQETICGEREVLQSVISLEGLNNKDVKPDSAVFSQVNSNGTDQEIKSGSIKSAVCEQTSSLEGDRDSKDLKPGLDDSSQIDSKEDVEDRSQVMGCQDVTQDRSQVIGSQDITQHRSQGIGSQDRSQVIGCQSIAQESGHIKGSSQMKKCSPEDVVMLSCSNEADIDTDAVEKIDTDTMGKIDTGPKETIDTVAVEKTGIDEVEKIDTCAVENMDTVAVGNIDTGALEKTDTIAVEKIDTDVMDVDDKGLTSAIHRTFQDSFDSFLRANQTSKSHEAAESLKTQSIEDGREIHDNEGVDKTTSLTNLISSGQTRPLSEGFTVDSEKVSVVSDSVMDVDPSEGKEHLGQEHPESRKETKVPVKIDDPGACLQPDVLEQKVQLEVSDRRDKDEESNVTSGSNRILHQQRADNDVSTKCEDVGTGSFSVGQKLDNKKESVAILQVLNKSGDVNYKSNIYGESVLRHCMDAAGDLKDSSSQQKLQSHAEAGQEEGEKWETEAQEKSKVGLGKLSESVKTVGVNCEENIHPGKLVNSGAETSIHKSTSPVQELLSHCHGSSTVGEPDLSKTKSCNSGFDVQSHVSPRDSELLKTELISKCRSGLEMCASRFPCHYKSLYRLAHLYYQTKELDKARDILLGRPDWQEHPYMPAPGLFADRKQNNFFQGLWKIPVEDIDRSGSFASHVHRSVRLLFEVLCDLGDLEMLKNLHSQLRRTPDPGKKYLRDAERLVLAEEAFLKCVTVVQQDMETGSQWSEEQREENLLRVYQVWVSGKGSKHIDRMTDALLRAFKVMMKGRTDVNRLTAAQAISFCQQNFSKALTPSVPVTATAQSKVSNQYLTERGKDGLAGVVEKVGKDGPVGSSEKGCKDGQVGGVEKAELDQTSSKQTEQQQTHMKPEITAKDAPKTQQRTDSSSDTGNPGSATVYTSIRPSSDLPDHTTTARKADEDVIVLSD